MNLDDVKTGDRLWTMILGPNGLDYLTDPIPQEVICLSVEGVSLQDIGEMIERVKCKLVAGEITFVIPARDLHPTREGVIRQALAAINNHTEKLREASERYAKMLKDAPA